MTAPEWQHALMLNYFARHVTAFIWQPDIYLYCKRADKKKRSCLAATSL